ERDVLEAVLVRGMHPVEPVHREDVLGRHATRDASAWSSGRRLPAPAELAQLTAVAHAEARQQQAEDEGDHEPQDAEDLAVADGHQDPGEQEAEARRGARAPERADDP